jgi:hypothetical protein
MNHRFPLPVDHSHAQRVVPLRTAVLLGLVLLEIGFFAGAIGFGEALLSLHG